jgi:hypothetical protein
MAERLVSEDAEAIIREVIAAALDRDPTAMRLLFERVYPARKGAPLRIDLPSIDTLDDVLKAQTAVINAMSKGNISPDEASLITTVIEAQRKTFESIDLERRITALEAKDGSSETGSARDAEAFDEAKRYEAEVKSAKDIES